MFMVAGYETDLGDKVGGGPVNWGGLEVARKPSRQKHRKRGCILEQNCQKLVMDKKIWVSKRRASVSTPITTTRTWNYLNREVGLGSQFWRFQYILSWSWGLCAPEKAALPSRVMEEDAGLLLGILHSPRGCALKTPDFASGPPLNSNRLPKLWWTGHWGERFKSQQRFPVSDEQQGKGVTMYWSVGKGFCLGNMRA